MASDCLEETGLLGKEATVSWGNKRRKLGCYQSPLLFPCFRQKQVDTWDQLQADHGQQQWPEAWVLCDTPLQELGEPLTSHVTRETSSVHGPSVIRPGSPGAQPGQQGPRRLHPAGALRAGYQSASGGAACWSGRREAAAARSSIFLTFGFCIKGGAI